MRKVKIKTWAAMEKEFGLSCLNSINVPVESFMDNMEKEMPANRIIAINPRDEEEGKGYLWEVGNGDSWIITEDMIECDMMDIRDNDIHEFMAYVEAHPHQRFWQALRNWSGHAFIYASEELVEDERLRDTYYI